MNYIIVSENNQWLATGHDEDAECLKETIAEVRERLVDNGEDADTKLYLYEFIKVTEV